MVVVPLVPLSEVYADAHRECYAIGQFNVSNLEFTQAVIRTAAELGSPVILGASESAVKYAGAHNLVAMVKAEAERVDIPVALHLDHGPSLELVKECIEAGFTSVMIDGSHHSLDDNIKVTREVADYEFTLVTIYLWAAPCRRQLQKVEFSRTNPIMTRASV